MVVYENKKNVLEYLGIQYLEEGVSHCHKEYEVVVCISGEATAFVYDTKYLLTAGKLLIVFPYQLHSYKNLKNGEYRLFIFSSDFLSGVKNLNGHKNIFEYQKCKRINYILNTLDKEYDYDTKINYFDMFLIGCINKMMRELILALKIEIGSGNFKLQQRLIEYCVKNSDKKISLQSVSDELLISPTKISKTLKNNFGLSFPAFINALRITNACVLLKDPDVSITQIAFDVGFGSI